MLAARGIALVYGGAQVGLMGALAEGAKQNGGIYHRSLTPILTDQRNSSS
ncbi:hypothetical protein [Planobacterium oryzisoli]|nr:hypothetical protein [Planobacterium oryzisoli]